jgi:hypothetical protein
MKRQLVYPAQEVLETDILSSNLDAYIGLSKLGHSLFGAATMANDLVCAPGTGLNVTVGPGELYTPQVVDATDYSTLGENSAVILKQGLLLASMTLSCPAPSTAGQSIVYLIEAQVQQTDGGETLLPYYDVSNPTVAYMGPSGNGLENYTTRDDLLVLQVKAGTAATTGSQVAPTADAGWTPLYTVTVAHGATSISGSNIAFASGAPFVPFHLSAAGQVLTVNASATLTASQSGKSLLVPATGVTLTLPAASTVPNGTYYEVVTQTYPVTVAPGNGADVIAGGSAGASYTVSAGQSLILRLTDTGYWLVAGWGQAAQAAANAYAAAQAAAALGAAETSAASLYLPLAGGTCTGPVFGQQGLAGTTVIGQGWGVRVAADSTNTSALLQFTNFAQSSQWGQLVVNSAGLMIWTGALTVDGNLTLNGVPTTTNQAANKGYVDTGDANTLSSAESFASSAAGTAQSNAETYAASQASAAQAAAETFATSAAGTAQSNAETFATTADAVVLAAAQVYAQTLTLVEVVITTPGAFSISIPANALASAEGFATGGGGGAGGPGSTKNGGGGGGGGTAAGPLTITPGGAVTGSVGAGGAGGASSADGVAGSATTLAALTGNGGGGGTVVANNSGGTGGGASGGQLAIQGGDGIDGSPTTNVTPWAAGGGSYWGGGLRASSGSATTTSQPYGAGGGAVYSTPTGPGGSGINGVAVLRYWTL